MGIRAEHMEQIMAAAAAHELEFKSKDTHGPSDYIVKTPGLPDLVATNLMPDNARTAYGVFIDCLINKRADTADYNKARDEFKKEMGFDPMEIINAQQKL